MEDQSRTNLNGGERIDGPFVFRLNSKGNGSFNGFLSLIICQR